MCWRCCTASQSNFERRFMSGVREPKLTQEQIEAYVADEKDLPAYGGAGSMMTHLKRASKNYRPTNSRARLTASERAHFAAQFAEVTPTPMSPEEEARILAAVDTGVKTH